MATLPIGTGHGLLSCPAGAGPLPGAPSQGVGTLAGAGQTGAGKMVAGKTLIAKGVAANGMAKGVVAGSTLAGGKGLSLGLGIGLGLWGPTILAGLGLVAAYTLWKSQTAVRALNEDDIEIGEALSDR
ncbi:putative Magnetite biomineralization protein Mms6 [Azospirillaceae bacterium]|nr:hypothetical protein MTCCP1_00016 [uncultured bacterium]